MQGAKKREEELWGSDAPIVYQEVQRCNIEKAEQLIEEGAEVNVSTGLSLLHLAAQGCHAEFVSYLLNHGAKIDYACQVVEHRNKTPFTALHLACTKLADTKEEVDAQLSTIRRLLDAGADISLNGNPTIHEYAYTPLGIACIAGQVEVARLLLERGANVEDGAEDGTTPLMIAACNIWYSRELTEILLERGANVNARNKAGLTPLYFACARAQTRCAHLLLNKGADAKFVSPEGDTPLSILLFNEEPREINGQIMNLAKELVAKGAKIDVGKYSYGLPCIMLAEYALKQPS